MSRSRSLYFAYGSNLNTSDFHDWCEKHGRPTDLLRFQSEVVLPDFTIAFTTWSSTRRGGVLDLKEQRGQIVPGVLYDVDDEGWDALDAKEGRLYECVEVTVLGAHGEAIPAHTYRVRAEFRKRFVEPNPAYVDVVRKGLSQWGLSEALLDAAVKNRVAKPESGFFFYGTLLRDERRFSLVQEFVTPCILLAGLPGRLLDLGEYPGLVDLDSSESVVHGEFVRFRNPGNAVAALDQIEGFRGFGRAGSLFRRTWVPVQVGDGRCRMGWTYCWNGDTAAGPVIPSGDWRQHHGRRDQFLERLVAVHARGDESALARAVASRYALFHRGEADPASILPLSQSLASGRISERKMAQSSGVWAAIP